MVDAGPPTGAVSDVLGNAGDCPRVRWREADYRVAWPSVRTIGRLELLVAAAATTEAKELAAAGIDPGAVEANRLLLLGRGHKVGGPLWERYLAGPDAGTLILLSLLREHHPDLAEADALAMTLEAGADTSAAMAVVEPGFSAAVEAAKRLPAGSIARPTGPARG